LATYFFELNGERNLIINIIIFKNYKIIHLYMKRNILHRKKAHIDICLNSDVTFGKSNGFEKYEFVHNPLTEVNIDKINFTTEFLSKTISFPFLISSMTGGTDETLKLNEKLSIVANELNIPIGVGSQRIMLEDSSTLESFKVIRKNAPNVPVLSNIGAGQIVKIDDISKLQLITEPIEADGMIIHLNPLQELLQNEGDKNFSGILNKLAKLKKELNIPLIVKEVGSGMDYETGKKLLDAGVDVIDVAGAGGTSWAAVELIRNDDETNYYFKEWGLRTSYSIREIARLKESNKFVLIGSGGINNFDDAAKAIALGADMVASAITILKTLDSKGVEGVIDFIINLFAGIKKIMFLTGSATLTELQKNKIKKLEELY
jgi:isopentenyl-diphosphate delta-isomerase